MKYFLSQFIRGCSRPLSLFNVRKEFVYLEDCKNGEEDLIELGINPLEWENARQEWSEEHGQREGIVFEIFAYELWMLDAIYGCVGGSNTRRRLLITDDRSHQYRVWAYKYPRDYIEPLALQVDAKDQSKRLTEATSYNLELATP